MTDDTDNHQVTGAPDAIWLTYGDIERDITHAECCASGDVGWCEDAQWPTDVRYTRTDLVAERVRAAVAAERERLRAELAEAVTALPQAVRNERERCAKLCEDYAKRGGLTTVEEVTAKRLADALRA